MKRNLGFISAARQHSLAILLASTMAIIARRAKTPAAVHPHSFAAKEHGKAQSHPGSDGVEKFHLDLEVKVTSTSSYWTSNSKG